MSLSKTGAFFWLTMGLQACAFAQAPLKPGNWELTGSFKGLPFAGAAERVRTACLDAAAFAALPEKVLMEAAPPPGDDPSRPGPQCQYAQVHREGPRSSWTLTCENPTLTGTGTATTAGPDRVDLTETLEMKMFGTRTIQHTVRARRLGDCS